jgi:hypothetical protein
MVKNRLPLYAIIVGMAVPWADLLAQDPNARPAAPGTLVTTEVLQYHAIVTDQDHRILPWVSPDPAVSYDRVIRLVWSFWKNMDLDTNGLRYYMNHQVWKPEHDPRGLGGDQLNMALSSWTLLYAYTGDVAVIENMRMIADEYLARSLSGPQDAWPDVPYPYNTAVHSGRYDGDMILGPGFTQPDKAGSFGCELVTLYKITGEPRYLAHAVKIANTLARHAQAGDADHSPLPFKVNARTGELGVLKASATGAVTQRSCYTTNWTGTLQLFSELVRLGQGDGEVYQKAFGLILDWMKAYPLKTNKWGPFFEDVPGWSDTQINAVTFAMYVLEHPGQFSNWKADARGILDWAWKDLGNKDWARYGVTVMNEQTAYRVPGNSHTSRQASIELLYCEKTGDRTTRANAVRALNWATYMVAEDGRNRYYHDDVWLTDGYGDYVRHFLRAMAASPDLAPADADHLLRTSSVVTRIAYDPNAVSYSVFDSGSQDVLRLTVRPVKVTVEGRTLEEVSSLQHVGWTWEPLTKGGVLRLRQDLGRSVRIEK